jgi:hypothetical protein
MKNIYLLLVMLSFACIGCVGPKIAADLLVNAKTSEKPLTGNSSIVTVGVNPRISNYEKLDETLKQSLEMALTKANIFGTDASKPYRIDANILVASQSPMSFGSFEGRLEIQYMVRDSNNRQILDKTIHTVAGSDRWSFLGAARHRRARAVNISKNVLQFVDILQSELQK